MTRRAGGAERERSAHHDEDPDSRALMAYIFEWDVEKAAANKQKHGVAFDEAATVFGDGLSVLARDPDHSWDEERYLLLGTSTAGRLLVVAFAERPPRTRLISARSANGRERRNYEQEG